MNETDYIPALRFAWLNKVYDPVVQLTMPERRFKLDLIEQADIGSSGHHILDFGCGTATLTMLTKAKYPGSFVTGIDVDASIIQLAHLKLKDFPHPIRLDSYGGTRLPYLDETFDRVISCLVFHHLTPSQKTTALRELNRVLKPGGVLCVGDWGRPRNPLMRGLFYSIQLLDGFGTTRDNVKGRLPAFIREAGFEDTKILKNYATIFGTLELIKAKK